MATTNHPRLTCSDRMLRYIEELIRCGGVKATAARRAEVPADTAYRWHYIDYFQDEYNRRKEHWLETLRATAMKEAIKGNEVLLKFLLASIDPEQYDSGVRRLIWAKKLGLGVGASHIAAAELAKHEEENKRATVINLVCAMSAEIERNILPGEEALLGADFEDSFAKNTLLGQGARV